MADEQILNKIVNYTVEEKIKARLLDGRDEKKYDRQRTNGSCHVQRRPVETVNLYGLKKNGEDSFKK